MKLRSLLFTLGVITLSGACGSVESAGLSTPDVMRPLSSLTLVLPTPNITTDFVAANGLVLTIRNDGARDYFARLGDGANPSLDQSLLFLAGGTSARLEKFTANQWSAVQSATLVDGARVVVLRARRTYALRAALPAALTPGTYRVVLGFSDTQAGAEGVPEWAVFSPVFSVQ